MRKQSKNRLSSVTPHLTSRGSGIKKIIEEAPKQETKSQSQPLFNSTDKLANIHKTPVITNYYELNSKPCK
jgi:hypothetical protein